MNEYLTPAFARHTITTSPGSVVVYFVKRTNGEERRMVCFHNPEEAEKRTFRVNLAAKNLLPVWDVEKGAVRNVPLDAVRRIVRGEHNVTPEFEAAYMAKKARIESVAKEAARAATMKRATIFDNIPEGGFARRRSTR